MCDHSMLQIPALDATSQMDSRSRVFECHFAYLSRVNLLAREGVLVCSHVGVCGVRWVLCSGFVASLS
jgi:ketopantoate hydroxymethyltransferase